MSEKLKPCPFCGGKAEVTTDPDDNWSHVECFDCNFRLSEIYDPEQTAIIKAWNARANDTLLAERDALLREALELIVSGEFTPFPARSLVDKIRKAIGEGKSD